MGHRGGKKRTNPKPNYFVKGFNKNYWQSDGYNARLYNYYRNIIMQLAMNRFRWVNLPKTCDARFLEWTLLTQGVATIAFPKKMKGTFFSTQAVIQSPPNVYDNPTKWRSYGNNGWTFNCDGTNGVLVFDNCTRMPILEGIDLYATELVHIRKTKQMNRFHQQVPWILTGPQEKRQDMNNILKQVAGGELAIIATDGLSNMEVKVLSTGVPYLGEQLAADEGQVWNRIYTMLGIDNVPFKSERQTEDEVRAQKTPTEFIKMASLSERRKAADKLNNLFGGYLEAPIKVEWNRDNESVNWNFQHNIETQLDKLG